MPIKFRCPFCEQFLGISEAQAGSIAECPTCGRSIRVPDLDGSVHPLPRLELDLKDEKLRQALEALAHLNSSHGTGEVVTDNSSRVSRTDLSPVLFPEPRVESELAVAPVLLRNEAPGSIPSALEANVDFATSLKLITCANDRASVESESRVEVPRETSGRFSTRFVCWAVFGSLVCGGLLGLALNRSTSDSLQKSEIPAKRSESGSVEANVAQLEIVDLKGPVAPHGDSKEAELAGTITYPGAGGERKPDRGAQILLLPMQRIGTAKISGSGFRVGAEAVDRQLMLAEVTALGGEFASADENGEFRLKMKEPGRYGMLIASRYYSRPATIPISATCLKFLALYFERPELVLGSVDYQFQELSLEAGGTISRDFHFSIR